MEEETIRGLLCLEFDPEDELDNEDWVIYDDQDKKTWLDRILTEFEGHKVEIKIKSISPPRSPPT